MKKIIISWQKTGLAAALMLLSVFLCQVSQARDIKLLGDDETERVFDALADDLALWNHPDRPVQRRWIRTICSPGKDGNIKNNGNNENEMEDEENVD